MRLGAFADVHAGAYPQYADDRLAEQEAVLAQAVEVFNAEGVDAILFAGDATHRNKPTPAELLAFVRPLLAAHAPILAINGNTHDVGNAGEAIALDLLNRDLYGAVRGTGVLRLSRTPEILELDDLRVATLPWAPVSRLVASQNGGDRDEINRDAAERLLSVARGLRAEIYKQEELIGRPLASVLLTHFAIDEDPHGLSKFMREPVLPLADLLAVGFDAGIAGHLHPPGLMNEQPPWLYCGSPYPLDFSEGGYPHGVWIVDVEPGRAEARFVPLESRRFVTIDLAPVAVECLANGGSVTFDDEEEDYTEEVDGSIVRVRYTATQEQARRIDNSAITRSLLDAGAHRAYVNGEIVREQRARVEGVDEHLDTRSALSLWITHNDVDPRLAEALHDRHDLYTAELAQAGKLRKAGGGGSIRPARLRAENYGPYETVDLPFVEGCTAILGEIRGGPPGVVSNGAGKSHLLNAIPLALYGPPKGLSLGDFLTNDGEGTELMVELTFDRGGEVYRVRRSWSARGAGKATLDLEYREPDTDEDDFGWAPLTAGSMKETQAEIEGLIGLTQETFLASSVKLQDAPSFASKHVSRLERCDLLADALGLDEYDEYKQLATRDRRAGEAQQATISARLEAAELELAGKEAAHLSLVEACYHTNAASDGLGEAEQRLESLTEQHRQAEQRASERRAAEAEHQAAEKERRRLREQAEAAVAARESIAATRERLAGLASAEQAAAAEQAYSEARAAYDAQAFERQTLEAKLADAEERLQMLGNEHADAGMRALIAAGVIMPLKSGGAVTCRECGQLLSTPDARALALLNAEEDAAAIRARVDELAAAMLEQETHAVLFREELAALGVAVAPDDAEVRRAREQVLERARLEERISTWQHVVDADNAVTPWQLAESNELLITTTAALAALPPIDQEEIERIKQQGLQARAQVNEQRQRLDEARAEKARLEARLERLQQVETQMQAWAREAVDLRFALDTLTVLERAYGRDGIPSLILENVAIPYLEAEASRLLDRLGLPWQVEIRQDKQNKTREGTRPALDVVLVKHNGVTQPYRKFSGGEETRIGYALTIALARLIQNRSGVSFVLLGLDEPPYLDAAGMATLIAILPELEQEFPIIWLISQVSELRDSFEQTILVVQEDGRSRVADARQAAYAAAETVAA